MLSGVREHFESGRDADGYLRPFKRKLVDVFVSRGTLDRAFRTAQIVFDALEERGHRVCLAPSTHNYRRPGVDPRAESNDRQYWGPSWAPSSPTVVFIGTLAIGLSLFELSEGVEMVLRNGDYIPVSEAASLRGRRRYHPGDWTTRKDRPSGRLCLRAYCAHGFGAWFKEWRESTPGDLDGKAVAIAREVVRNAPAVVAEIEEGRRAAELEFERSQAAYREWERQEAERKRQEAREASRLQLLQAITAWGEANRIEQFFTDVEKRASCLGDAERDALLSRVRLAREMIGEVDALSRFRVWRAPGERAVR